MHKERARELQEPDFTPKEPKKSLMHLETQHTISLKESGSDPLADLGESLRETEGNWDPLGRVSLQKTLLTAI